MRNFNKSTFSMKATILAFSLALATLISACDNKPKQDQTDKAEDKMQKEVKDAAKATKDYVAKERKQLEERLSTSLDQTEKRIQKIDDKLAAEQEVLSEEMKQELKASKASLQAFQKELQQKSEKLAEASNEEFEEVKAETTEALNDFEKRAEKAWKEIKKELP